MIFEKYRVKKIKLSFKDTKSIFVDLLRIEKESLYF